MLTPRVVREKQKKYYKREEQSSADSWREVTGVFFLFLLTSCQLVPKADDKPKVIENPTFHGPESQGEPRSVPYIPGQEYQKFDYKIKRIRKKKRSGRGRRKRSRVIRYRYYYGTAEGEGDDDDDDDGLFTRLWRWIGSLFTWKTTAITPLQQVDRVDDKNHDVKTTSLVQDVDKKRTDLEEKTETICAEKSDDHKETTCDVKDEEEKANIVKECHKDSNIENQQALVLENEKSLNVKDSCTNENVVSGCFLVQKLETHVLKKTDDPKHYDLVPLKQLEQPAQKTTDTTTGIASSEIACCPIQKLIPRVQQETKEPELNGLVPLKQLENKPAQQTTDATTKAEMETHILQKTDVLIPPKALEDKPSLQLSVDTTTENNASASPGCRPVQILETQVEPNQTQVDTKEKVSKRKKRSGVKRRRKGKRSIRYQENKRKAEDVDGDVSLFTRLWRWIGSFFTRQTAAATPLQQEGRGDECPEDAAKTTSLLQDVDSNKKQTDLEEKRTVCQDKREGNKETTACDIREEERKLKDVIKKGPCQDKSSIKQRKNVVLENEKSLTVKESCTDENVVSGCFTVQQLEAHIMQETDDPKPFDLVSFKQLENHPSSKTPEDTTTEADSSCPRGCVIRRMETHVLQETEDPKCFNLLPLKQLENNPSSKTPEDTTEAASFGLVGCVIRRLETHVLQETEDPKCFNLIPLKQLENQPTQLPLSKETLEARSKRMMRSDGDKSILGHRQSLPDLQKTGKSKTVSVVPKQPEHKGATASQECKGSTTSWRKTVPRTTLTRDAELSSTGLSMSKVQPSKERSKIFKGNDQKDSRKQADFVRSRQTDQAKDHLPSTRHYKPNKKSNPKQTTDLSSKEEKHLSWRNGSKESAESFKGHAHSTWGNQKKGSESHLVPSSNWRRSSSKGDMSSNWRKDNGTDKPVSKSQTSSWRRGTNNTRTSSNEGTSPYWRNNKETRAGPCESNWRTNPRKQTNHTMERSSEKCQSSTAATAREKTELNAKESAIEMTYAQAVLRGRPAVRNPPAAMIPARAVLTETRYRPSHGQRQRRSNPISRR